MPFIDISPPSALTLGRNTQRDQPRPQLQSQPQSLGQTQRDIELDSKSRSSSSDSDVLKELNVDHDLTDFSKQGCLRNTKKLTLHLGPTCLIAPEVAGSLEPIDLPNLQVLEIVKSSQYVSETRQMYCLPAMYTRLLRPKKLIIPAHRDPTITQFLNIPSLESLILNISIIYAFNTRHFLENALFLPPRRIKKVTIIFNRPGFTRYKGFPQLPYHEPTFSRRKAGPYGAWVDQLAKLILVREQMPGGQVTIVDLSAKYADRVMEMLKRLKRSLEKRAAGKNKRKQSSAMGEVQGLEGSSGGSQGPVADAGGSHRSRKSGL